MRRWKSKSGDYQLDCYNQMQYATKKGKGKMAPDLKMIAINIFLILEVVNVVSANSNLDTQLNNNNNKSNDTRMSRLLTEMETGRGMMSHDYHDMEEPKAQKPWLGYYDFLITEGSYKFWVVFQLFTIAVLIYSAFAAIYYAKYTINDYDNYDDYLFGRSARSVRSVPPTQTAFLGLPVETYLRIFNAIANYGNK